MKTSVNLSQQNTKKMPTQMAINALRAMAAQPPITSIGSVGNFYARSPGGREGLNR